MIRTFRSLGIFNYRIFFFGAFISNIGTWMQRTAQDWIVLTHLTHDDAAAVGVTLALQFGPVLLLMPLSGLIADRVNRRKMLIATQLAMGLLGLGLGMIVLADVATLWEVYAFAFALGCVSAIDAPIRQTFVSELVSEKSIPNAVALNSASFNGARLIGPAVAGLMIAAVGSGWVFLSNAASFGAMLAALAFIRTGELNTHAKPPRKGGQIREGLRYVGSRPDIIVVLVMLFLIGTFGMNFAIFTSTMSLAFHRGADGYGVLSSVMAIGSVLGALLSARRDKPRIVVVGLASLGFGISMLASALMPSYWTFAAVLIVVGLAGLTTITSANAYVQTTTAPHMRGRVMALYMAIFAGTTPLGSPLIGWIANIAGPRWAIVVGASAGFAAAGVALVWMIVANRLRLHRDSTARFGLAVSYDHATQVRRKRALPEDLSTTEIAIQHP
jgi:MFS family permease